MYNYSTKPTKITEEQYRKGFLAVNRQNGDIWFVNEHDDIRLWLGQYPEDVSGYESDMMKGELNAQVEGVGVIGENGEEMDIEAIVFGVEDAPGRIDLEYLEEGKIRWM